MAYPNGNYVYTLTEAGTYNVTITFDPVSKAVNCIVEHAPAAPSSIVKVDTTSAEGNIYAFDSMDYYVAWPGVAIGSLESAAVGGTEYYMWGFNHENASGPYVIFSDSEGQIADIAVEDGDILKYLGFNKYILNGVEYPVAGDVNGDNEVDVRDITTLIDIIMSSGSNPRADVNGDQEIDVRDITALIDIIMAS